jgi:hypothetical protein
MPSSSSPRGHPKLVQELLEGYRYTTTLNIYSHVIPSLQDKTAWAMEDVLEEDSSSG